MMPDPTVYTKFYSFVGALSILTGAMAWWRKDGPSGDEVVVEACEVVIDSIADADAISLIDGATGKNLRDQISIAEAEDMRREADLRRYPNRN